MYNHSYLNIDLDLIKNWLKEAGRVVISQRKSLYIQTKPDNTLVTNIDKQLEAFLIERISNSYPGHRILTEESGYYGQSSEYLWIIDPIDGTRAFASGLPIWGISVGILYREVPIAGIYYMPDTGEISWGIEETGYYCGKPIIPLKAADIHDPLTFIAVPSNAHLLYDISFPRLRSLGSTTAHFLYVARGVAIAALTRNIGIWDIASVLPLLNAADVGIVYLSGKAFRLQTLLGSKAASEPLIVAPKSVLKDIRRLIQEKSRQL